MVLAQTLTTASTPIRTALYYVAKKGGGEWPVLLELGKSDGALHQMTISSDGKYAHVILVPPPGTGDYPQETVVVVDLIAKKEVSRVNIKGPTGAKSFAVLSAFAC